MSARSGTVVVLNGAPRSGKSTLAAALQQRFGRPLIALGVDVYAAMTPDRFKPGLGLRPGGERPDLEPLVGALYSALYGSVAEHSRLGLDIVVDVGHHDDYSVSLDTLGTATAALRGLPAYLIGVRCPLDVIMQRRNAAGDETYLASRPDGSVPEPVRRWQHAVHLPGVYDLEVDTSVSSPAQCADAILVRLAAGPGTAFDRIRPATITGH